MRTLERTLQDVDLGHLRIIAELWGLDMPPGRLAEAAPQLAQAMLAPGLALDIAQALPPNPRRALEALLAEGGRAPLGELSLRFGPMRTVGPGRRDREKTWRDATALDALWYRGFMSVGFFDTPAGPEEFGFIPDELRQALAPLAGASPARHRPSPAPPVVHPAGGAADDAVSILAALRRRPWRSRGGGLANAASPAGRATLERHLIHPRSLEPLVALLRGLGAIVPDPLRPDPARLRDLLAAGRSALEAQLFEAWRDTRTVNDLAGTPGLAAPKNTWPNDPAVSRASALAHLARLEEGEWFEIEGFVADIRRDHPAFLRPGGDFDSWMLEEAGSGRLLSGLAAWETIEGAYLRHLTTGPLHWLGAADTGATDAGSRPSHLRLRFDPADGRPAVAAAEDGPPARVHPDGRVVFAPLASLPHRYQVARFAEWVGRDATGYHYRLTPRALAAAAAQGLEARRVESLLETVAGRPLPDTLRGAIDRWARRGTEAVLEDSLVLRVKDPETLRSLRSDPATNRYLEEILGSKAARIRRRDREALVAAAARRGLLIELPDLS